MLAIQKRLVLDSRRRPVAVQIDIQDWLEIEKRLQLPSDDRPPTDLSEFYGSLNLTTDPIAFQREVRDEW